MKPKTDRRRRRRLWIGAALLLLAGYCVGSLGGDGGGGAEPAAAEAVEWTCAMHPQVRRPGPGPCPICGMDLVPVAQDEGADDRPRVLTMSPTAAALAEIETTRIERRHLGHEVRMVGKVVPDETRIAYITSWVPGRLDRLFVDYTGVTVRAGDHMVEVFSPELYSAQQELLQALETAEQVEGGAVDVLARSSREMVASARERLRQWGMTPEQIDAVVERRTASDHVVLNAPTGGVVIHKNAFEGMYVEVGTRIYTIADLSRIWVQLDAYESDLGWLRYGQDVEFVAAAYPGRVFHGRIAFIDPVLDDRTRTVKVRVNMDNGDFFLKPDMFVRATVEAVLTPHGRVLDPTLAGKWMCPMHPEVLADDPGACGICGMDLVTVEELGFATGSTDRPPLVVPSTAPLITGKRAVVYVQLPGDGAPRFEGREVVLGPRGPDAYVVLDGLEEGERVVTHGAFKIDSELQIRAQPSMMSPEGGAPPPGHDHGGGTAATAPAGAGTALRSLVTAYLPLQVALARDDAGAAAAAARDLLGTLDGLPDARADGWAPLAAAVREHATAIAAHDDLDAQRRDFAPLSGALVEAFDARPSVRLRAGTAVYHCPMALDGEGARWLQVGDETENPYFGASMLRCGDRRAATAGER